MTTAYYRDWFPLELLNEKVFNPAENAEKGCPYQFIVQTRPSQKEWRKDEPFSEFTETGALVKFLFNGKPDEKTAVHWRSATEKWLYFDLDVKDSIVEFGACRDLHREKAVFCEVCWDKLLNLAKLIEESVLQVFADLGLDRETAKLLYCFSGNRGLHLYVHPDSKLQWGGLKLRRAFIETVVAKAKLVSPDKTALLLAILDQGASIGNSESTIRLPFSPHLESEYCSTPFKPPPARMENGQIWKTKPPQFFAVSWKCPGLEPERLQEAVSTFRDWLDNRKNGK